MARIKSPRKVQRYSVEFKLKAVKLSDADTNQLAPDSTRQADVYVLALLRHDSKQTVNPLDISQWEFFVLSKGVLDARTRSQHSITLKTLQRLAGSSIAFDAVASAARTAFEQSKRVRHERLLSRAN
jgi:hypothetical protein